MTLKIVEPAERHAPAARQGLTLGGAPRARDAAPGLSYALDLREGEPGSAPIDQRDSQRPVAVRLATRDGLHLA